MSFFFNLEEVEVRKLMMVVMVVVMVGCSETNILNTLPTEPVAPPVVVEEEAPDINGSWSGSLSDQGAVIVSALWTGTVTQAGVSWTGTWSTSTGLTGSFSGAVDQSGRLSGGLTYTDATGTCSGRLDGSATSSKLDFKATGLAGACAPVPTVLDVEAGR